MRKEAVGLLVGLGLLIAAPAKADSSLAGWWHFNEGSGTVAARDAFP
jgi:hypothetical protein